MTCQKLLFALYLWLSPIKVLELRTGKSEGSFLILTPSNFYIWWLFLLILKSQQRFLVVMWATSTFGVDSFDPLVS